MKTKIAYITSMATGGLAGFNYRELNEMVKIGIKPLLFVTKYQTGPYMPPPGTICCKIQLFDLIFGQITGFFSHPILYLRLFLESIKMKSTVDFIISQSWIPIIQKYGSERIHCHWGDHKFFIGYYCHKITKLPLSVTLHGYDLYGNPNLKMFEHCLPFCDLIITISDYNRNLLIKRYGSIVEKKIRVIRLSADTLPDLNSKKRILIVGGFHPRKGYDILLHALHSLNRNDYVLWVVGYNGPIDVPGLVNKLDLKDNVIIFGHISDSVLKLLYSQCDIFCLPSRFPENGIGEGLPVSLMEAMSYAKPVISTYHTGIPELVKEVLVNENDIPALAKGIAYLLDNPQEWNQMGDLNRQIIENDYSNDNVTKLAQTLMRDETNESRN